MNVNKLLQNYNFDKDKDYTILEKKINELLEELEFTDDKKKETLILEKINEIKKKLKNIKTDTYLKYPNYTDKKFVEKLLIKKEFAINKINLTDEKKN